MVNHLMITVTNRNGRRVEETTVGVVKIGRDDDCEVRISDDPTVARKHAVIDLSGNGDCTITGIGGMITVNGNYVDKSILIAGDVVTVGRTTIGIAKITAAAPQVMRPPPMPPSVPMPAAKAQQRIVPPPPRRPSVAAVNTVVSAARRLVARLVRAALAIEREEP